MCITFPVHRLLTAAGVAAATALASGSASAQTATTFTYQGVLEEGGSPVTGTESIRFRLFSGPVGGPVLSETTQAVNASDGVFTAQVDLGPLNSVSLPSAWIEIAVSTGPGTFETLGRQRMTATPFSLNTRGIRVDSSGEVTITADDNPTNQAVLNLDAGSNSFAAVDFFTNGIREWGLGKDFANNFFIGKPGETNLFIDDLTGEVGVGTDDTRFPVTIQGDALGDSIGVRSSTGGSGYHLGFTGDALVLVESGDKIRGRFTDDDKIVIGSGTGFFNAGVTIDLPQSFGLALMQGNAAKPGGGAWAVTSDARLKKNIENIEGALDTLLSLRGVTYEYKDPETIGELSGTCTGFIAQETEQVIPDWVIDGEDGYKRIAIHGFEAMAVEAIREQQEQIAAMQTEIESLKGERTLVGASAWMPLLVGGVVISGFAVARRRMTKA